jgi:putative PIG3 family NAD(P)H quinone oxidoreductase
MRVIQVKQPGSADELTLAEQAAPKPQADELLIEVAYAGVNRPDIIQRQGFYPPPVGASPLLGLEVSGRVMAVGAEVQGWLVGDAVCALTNGGGYAEQVCVSAGQCLPVPQGLSLRQAAALPETAFTVWGNVFDRAQLREGETLLVHAGASGIGSMAIQMAVAQGALVYATASSAEKCEACIGLGAELAINYNQDDFVERILAVTDGRGVDVILDMVGGDYLQRNISCAAEEGRVVNIAYLRGSMAELNMMPVMLKRLTLTGSTLRPQSSAAKTAIAEKLKASIWPDIVTGQIVPLLHPVDFSLEQVADAHRLMEANEVIGKLVLTVNSKLENNNE